MRPQKQANRHDPSKGLYGDCHRTCLAMLLDLDKHEVPNYAEEAPDDWHRFHALFEDWLNARGLATFQIAFAAELQGVLTTMGFVNPGTYYILGGFSRSGVGHSVIAMGNQIIADPSLSDAGIVGPMDDGNYWITLLIPLHQKANAIPVVTDPDYAGLKESDDV